MKCASVGVALGALCLAMPAQADPLPRPSPAAGSVIARKSGEEVRFVDISSWRYVDLQQDLLSGDVLRTNATGQLAVLFSDRTQVRLGRNTSLLVKRMGGNSDTGLELQSGTIWARAERGGQGVVIDTPAAAAAIRGTDWTMTVGADGKTSLIVLEGVVELTNAQGSVKVEQGEGAVAAIGQAPRKYILVDLKEREQILLYNELRGVFTDLPVSGAGGPETRSERARILAMAPGARRAEDWIALAETALENDGRATAKAALAELKYPLPAQLKARAKLVEAMIAGLELRYSDAARLFSVALPDLPPNRRSAAAYGLWFAEALAHPDRQSRPPPTRSSMDDATSAMARAATAAYTGGQAEAIEILRAAERRFPHDARLPAMRADLAYQLDRRDEVQEALARAKAIDPDEPAYLLINARFRATVSSDLDGALADLKHAVEIAPGADEIWNEIGIVQSDRNAIVEADAAHRKAIELNPENAALHANYARFLMDNDQVNAAKATIDAAEALDAHSYAVLAAKGRYLLRIGKAEEGEKTLLEASAINPTYGDSLIGLAIAAYQKEAGEEAAQALDNADRFDRDNPSIPLIRSGIALDQYQADEAIVQAREALRRRQARGGYYGGYDANRQVSSFLGITLDNLGLTEWGQYYADRAYDPFVGTTYLDEAASGRIAPFADTTPRSPMERVQSGASTFSSQLQAFMLDPLAIASAARRNSLERTEFFEATVGGDFILDDGEPGWRSDFLVQGTTYSPLPLSYYVQAETDRQKSARENDYTDITGGLFQVGLHPTLDDRAFLFGNIVTVDTGFPGQSEFPTLFDHSQTQLSNLGAGWSHTIADRNVIQGFVVAGKTEVDRQIDLFDEVGPYRLNDSSKTENVTLGANHLYGIGPLTLRYGAELSAYRTSGSSFFTDLLTAEIFFTDEFADHGTATRAYADLIWDVSKDLQFQGGVYANWSDDSNDDCGCIDPRFGVSWSPTENHWLRAFYREDTQYASDYTLSPISTVGLTPLELPLFMEGETKTAALRWDAEWSEQFFTSVEYQHQELDGLSLDIPDLLGTFDSMTGEIDRVNVSANYWIGGGFGTFGSFTWNHSMDTTSGRGRDFGLPLIPEYLGQAGLTFVHPSRVKVTVAQNFVGSRVGAQFGIEIDPYTTTDAAISWKSPSSHMELGLQMLNIFDTDFERAFGVPGWGPTVRGTIKVRF